MESDLGENRRYLSNNKRWEDYVLLFHGANKGMGLNCNGLLDDDPIEDYSSKLPVWWNENELLSLRYIYLDHIIYFKFLLIENTLSINALSSNNNTNLVTYEFK